MNRHSGSVLSLQTYKRTKIIATLGPATNSYQSVEELMKAGVNGFRLNFSHGTPAEKSQQIKWIRRASTEIGKPVAVIQDLQGPKIRLGDFEDVVSVRPGQGLSFSAKRTANRDGHLPLMHDISPYLKRGQRMLIYDGKIEAVVSAVRDKVIYTEVKNEGVLIKRKGINLPDSDLEGEIITAKDKADIVFGSSLDIDYVALSFVQTADDIEALKKLLRSVNSQAGVMAKLETAASIDNAEAIIRASDCVMIARGDLAIETSPESVPISQRQVIGLGLALAKPTIVATQMLASMSDWTEPTRAEVSDVANAVLSGADAVMLSDETAAGKHPIEAVRMMKRVILYTEQHQTGLVVSQPELTKEGSAQAAIGRAIIHLAEDLSAVAVVAETRSGATALAIAARRPSLPIIAVTNDTRTATKLAIVNGVKSYVRPIDKLAATKLTNWLKQQRVFKDGDMVIIVSGKYPGVVGTTDTIKVRLID